MNAIPYDRPEEEWDSYEDEQETALPGRPRRKLLTWWTAGLFALLLGAIGFYVGIRIEKNQIANSSSTSGLAAFTGAGAGAGTGAAGRAGGGTGAAGRAGAAGAGTGAAGRTGAAGAGTSGAGGGGFRGLFGGAGAGGNATLGTVSNISGDSLYITETSGTTVKVTLSSATKVTKNVAVGKNAVRPGDLVTVAGAKSSNGTVSATTVNDTGASPFGSTSSSSGSSSSGNSGSSAVSSLFGGG